MSIFTMKKVAIASIIATSLAGCMGVEDGASIERAVEVCKGYGGVRHAARDAGHNELRVTCNSGRFVKTIVPEVVLRE